MMKLKIKVTKDVLKRSINCNSLQAGVSKNCAIAVAIRDIFPNASVGVFDMYILGVGNVDLPENAREFISKFDMLTNRKHERLFLDPIEFEIELTDEQVDLLPINIDEAKSIIEDSQTLELILTP